MAGRDYRSFVLKNRSNPQGLLARLRREPAEKLINLENDRDYIIFETHTGDRREFRLLKQHQATWAKEWSTLQIEENRIVKELMELPGIWHKNHLVDEISSVIELENEIDANFKEFYDELVSPLITLRWDLQFWYNSYLTNQNFGQGDPKTVYHLLSSIHKQRQEVIDSLATEVEAKSDFYLSKELLYGSVDDYQGIPTCMNFECCPRDLKKSLIDEFIILDIKYQQKIFIVKERYHAFVRIHNGGWTDKEHFIFKHIVKLYPAQLANYQELSFDMLIKLLPHFNTDDLAIHQSWINHRHKYKDSIIAVLTDWKRCKNELAIKSQSIIYRAHKVYKETSEKKIARQKQKDICYDLYIKVVQWRQWKLQRMLVEEEREKMQFQENLKREQMAENERRMSIKLKLEHYRQEQIKSKEDLQQQMKLQALKTRKLRVEQTLYNTRRIRYREAQRIAQLEMKKMYQVQRTKAEEERKKRLDKLRLQVSVTADPDPLRMLQNTLSFDAKRKRDYEDDPIPILKPLFEVYSFNDDQLTADTRIRLEAKLREANLVHLPYAQEILKQLPPPTKPRRDTKSTISFRHPD
uniref:Coiled-coil domain-containing protein 148 n=1 Tax=Strigamia maritima TaxID=126957 RepID=T1J6T9_STRMM